MKITRLIGIAFAVALPSIALAAFRDVEPNHPNVEAITYVQTQGIVSGYPDGSYRPDQPINRAEFTKIIIEAIADDEELRNCDLSTIEYLSDMDTRQWYAPYVCVGKARGIITGHVPSSAAPYFAPTERINITGAAKIIAAGFGIGEPPLDCLADWGKACAEAAKRGDPWYRRHLIALAERNAIPLTIKNLQYDDITRGEMAEMIWRLKANVHDRPSRTFSELNFAAGWYTSQQYGFEIAWPSSWDVVSEDADRIAFGQLRNFGGDGYDGEWFVFVFNTSEMSMDKFALEMGDQFADRNERREQININGLIATKITVTTQSDPSWIYEAVLIEQDAKLFVIGNGAVPNELFDDFYNTFRLLNRV